jgi:hypothetical protein
VIVLGRLMLLSGAALVLWVFLQIGAFLSTAAVHPDAVPRVDDLFFVPVPSKETYDNWFFYFFGALGSLAWMVEVGFAALLIITGLRMISTERRLRAEDQQAIDRIKRSQQVLRE